MCTEVLRALDARIIVNALICYLDAHESCLMNNLQVSVPLAADAVTTGPPITPGIALSTPAMSVPAPILPAASTALSADAAQPGIQLDVNQIAQKWGHSNGLVNHAEPKQVCVHLALKLQRLLL